MAGRRAVGRPRRPRARHQRADAGRALNPDFGQVEADTVVLNLSTFETSFPEKRPFFLEGIDAFATVRPLVYTRRIGRQPVTPVLIVDGEAGRAARIRRRSTARRSWSGRSATRNTVGLMSALTGPNDVEIIDGDGVRTLRRLDPWTTFNIARLKRKLPRTPRSACSRRRSTASRRRCRSAPPARARRPAPRRALHQRRLRLQHRRPLAIPRGRLRGRLAGGRHDAAQRPAALPA